MKCRFEMIKVIICMKDTCNGLCAPYCATRPIWFLAAIRCTSITLIKVIANDPARRNHMPDTIQCLTKKMRFIYNEAWACTRFRLRPICRASQKDLYPAMSTQSRKNIMSTPNILATNQRLPDILFQYLSSSLCAPSTF